jgi:hypothetical protein
MVFLDPQIDGVSGTGDQRLSWADIYMDIKWQELISKMPPGQVQVVQGQSTYMDIGSQLSACHL